MQCENDIHIGCDMWIIREHMCTEAWPQMPPTQRESVIAEQLGEEASGYELPEDYAPNCVRWHLFAGHPENDVCLGMVNGCYWVDPLKLALAWPTLMPRHAEADQHGLAAALDEDGIYLISLEGREVKRVYLVRAGECWNV